MIKKRFLHINKFFRFLGVCMLIFNGLHAYSQIGGTSTYQFLHLPNSARVTSMGGKINALHDNDLSLAFQNPALLSKSMHNQINLNYVDYFADINFGYFSYAHDFKNAGTFAAGIQYINYGNFTEADETGIITGKFSAAEYAFNLLWSKPLNDSNWVVGVNIKPITSFLERYFSLGIAADVGITHHQPENDLTAALVLKNIGTQIIAYNHQNYEPLPFEIQMGLSQKLKHAPFRYSIVAQQLQMLDMTYDMPDDNNNLLEDNVTSNNDVSDFEKYSDITLRHLIFAGEIILTENLYFRLGYNYQRRMEMNVDTDFFTTVGFSWGFGIKIYKFHINYARSAYHLAGSPNHFSLSFDLDNFINVYH